MYYGEVTDELETLYAQYYEKFGVEPCGYEELEYGNSSYKDFVKDIRAAIKLNMELPSLPWLIGEYEDDCDY